MTPTIRPARESDQRTIRRLIREAGINPMNLRWPNFVIAEEEGAVVGIGQVKNHSDGSRELASIAVVPGRQGQGIGSAVIKELLVRHGAEVLYLTCRPLHQGYYERFGFQLLERHHYPPYFGRLLRIANAFASPARPRIIVMRRLPTR
jgi:N-acetylglutamate synthase-like GNAT family acetyltransferase